MTNIVARYRGGRFPPGLSGNPAGRPRGSGALRRVHDELTGLGATAEEIVELAKTAGRPAASAAVIARIMARLTADADREKAATHPPRRKDTPDLGA